MVMLLALLGGDVNALALVLLLLPRDWGDEVMVVPCLPLFIDLGVIGKLVPIVVAATDAVVSFIFEAVGVIDFVSAVVFVVAALLVALLVFALGLDGVCTLAESLLLLLLPLFELRYFFFVVDAS